MIQRLSQRSQSIAQGFVQEHARLIARDAVASLVRSYIAAAEASMKNAKMADLQGPEAVTFIKDARQRVNEDYAAVLQDYGNSNAVLPITKTSFKLCRQRVSWPLGRQHL